MTPQVDGGYDPADNAIKSYDLCISELRKQLLAERTVKDQTALLYLSEEDGNLFINVKAQEIGYWRFPVSPEKVLDVVSEGARLARVAIASRK